MPGPPAGPLPGYAELHCRSHFSFLTGASHPEELVQRAHDLGYAALALTDECSVAGVVRAHEAARQVGLPLVVGSLLRLHGEGGTPGCVLIALALDREGYGDLCELITLGRSRAPKGHYRLSVRDLDAPPPALAHLRGLPRCHLLWLPQPLALPPDAEDARIHPVGDPPRPALPPEDWPDQARWVRATFGDRADAAVQRLRRAGEAAWVARLEAVAAQAGLPLVATGDVLMHRRSRKPLQDTLTALRLQRPLAECGRALAPNAEQHLRPRATLAGLMRPEWLARSVEIAQACRFRLDELRYEYPEEIVPAGHTPTSWLRHETEAGLRRRYPGGAPAPVLAQIERELALVAELRYEAFFLTVHDIVGFARSRGILCQGRGSAANSAVCFCLGITEVDPTHTTLLFERFISRERDEPPDIDVDFEHERREEVIQYIYRRYGRDRTALAAALITYRSRGAVRDAGRALGLEEPVIAALARSCQWFDPPDELARRLGGLGLDPQAPLVRRWLALTNELQGVPRHLSQHVGGFVIARGKLSRLVPIENTAMADRQVIQWDKDDLESLGLLKVDVLALGMLSALRRALDLRAAWRGTRWSLGDIPREDPATYAMIQRADTVGTFQIESRAQQSMLPRLKPRTLYDLVIEVAIVRPGPIQGGMVHPYLRRKQGLEPATLPDPALEVALGRTLGVPIFQEQVMQVCMIAAGFSGGEADALRRAMAAWRRKGGVHQFHARVVEGMVERGYEREFAESIFRQILGFGDYGFPESHAYGFAILAYFSAWLKCHEPVILTAALLNSQPMGFYAPSQLVQDLRRHGGEVRPPDVSHSDWDCTLEPATPGPHRPPRDPGDAHGDAPQPALRLGLRLIAGLPRADAERLVAARRAGGPWRDLPDLARRSGLGPAELERLARADALRSLAGHRRQQAWQAAGEQPLPALLHGHAAAEAALALPEAPEAEEVVLDHVSTGLSLRRHPLALLRPRLRPLGWRTAAELEALEDGDPVWAAGIVVTRQQPETAGGTVFVTLEDETGPVNVIVWRAIRDRDREALLGARLLAVRGIWQRRDGVRHLVARRLVDASAWLGRLDPRSRDFR